MSAFDEDYNSDEEFAYKRARISLPTPKKFVPLGMYPDEASSELRYPFDLEWGNNMVTDADDGNFFGALDDYEEAFQANEAVVAEEQQQEQPPIEEELSDDYGEQDLFEAADEQRRISALKKGCLDKNGRPYDSYQSYKRAMIDAKRAVSRRMTPEEFEKYCRGNDAIEVSQKPELLQGAPPKWTKFETFAEVLEHYVTKKNRWPKGVPIKTKEGWARQKRLYLGLRDRFKREQKEFQQQRRN